jgi:hypothetical protein
MEMTMANLYDAPERIAGETNEQWCDRYAASIPADALLSEIVAGMHQLRKRRGPVWSQLGQLCGHGSGVSSALVRRFAKYPLTEDDTR